MRSNRKPNGLAISCVLAGAVVFAFPVAAQQGLVSPNKDLVLKNSDLVIRDGSDRERIRLDAQSGDWRVRDDKGNVVLLMQQDGRNLFLGGHGRAGDLVLLPRETSNQDLANASVHLDGSNGTQTLGGGGAGGRLVLKSGSGKQRIFLNGETADIILGQQGGDGKLVVRDANGNQKVRLDGASGRVQAGQIQAGQILSNHSGSGSGGIDTASVYLESANPAIGLRDNTGGNTKGWYVQSSNNGRLVFSAGTTTGLGNVVFALNPNGSICLGACQ